MRLFDESANLARTFYKDFTFYLQGFCNTEIYVKQTLDIMIGKFEDHRFLCVFGVLLI